ncbi:adenylosuccinate synthase [Candidatus Acetothermia bacterium]|jgi:adenylosuccinate synthase|nr:adenylosuccinate synthase [Candidatus Acetothermia bacterium]MCI2430964.1 adenylosuccinate synthase [Candidatus Acetothermia bacterium]MCI2437396.1 adenylosuccinate synthase [Candidatus Acetothermia bacterium]
MPAIAVLGAQWGDEGKGKIVHLLCRDADFCVRFNGGTNAGHRVVTSRIPALVGANGDDEPTETQEFKFHLIPAGALHENCICVLGNGMVIDPYALVQERNALRDALRGREPNIYISYGAHLLLPYHPIIERLEGSQSALDTTAKGIGPAYRDKAARIGLRMVDLLFPKTLPEKLQRVLAHYQSIWPEVKELQQFQSEALRDELLKLTETFRQRIIDTVQLLHDALEQEKQIVFEGAQAALLDLDFGTYPYVTSSTATIGGIGSGAGVPPSRVNRVIGVAKAYTTRVGHGPFPTEIHNDLGDRLRQQGHEFGTTTGRPRRCGWLDLVALRYVSKLDGLSELALTKLDVLAGLAEIPVATAYRYQGSTLHEFPAVCEMLSECEPIYEKLPGWDEPLGECHHFSDLPRAAQDYVRFIEDEINLPLSLISVGPGEDENLWR